MVLARMLRWSHMYCSWARRIISPAFFSAQYYTVRQPTVCSLIEVHFVRHIFLGVVTTLSFQCISTLLNPVNRAKGCVKWGLVSHTALMFSLSTAFVGMNLDVQSISYIDNRNWPGGDEIAPGPVGYQFLLDPDAFTAANNFMWFAGQWLSDGLLVGSIPNRVTHMSNTVHSSRCTVAFVFIL